jgi:hypothetical protein
VSSDASALLSVVSSLHVVLDVADAADGVAAVAMLGELRQAAARESIFFNVSVVTDAAATLCCGIAPLAALASRPGSATLPPPTDRVVVYVGSAAASLTVEHGSYASVAEQWQTVLALFADKAVGIDRVGWVALRSGSIVGDIWWARQSYLRLLTRPSGFTSATEWSARTRANVRGGGSSLQLGTADTDAATVEACDGTKGSGECEDGNGVVQRCNDAVTGCFAGFEHVYELCKGAVSTGSPRYDKCISTRPPYSEPMK